MNIQRLNDKSLSCVNGGLYLNINGKNVILFGPGNSAPEPGTVVPRSNIFAAPGLDNQPVVATGGFKDIDGINGWDQ